MACAVITLRGTKERWATGERMIHGERREWPYRWYQHPQPKRSLVRVSLAQWHYAYEDVAHDQSNGII